MTGPAVSARIRVETGAVDLTVSASARNVIVAAGAVNVLLSESDAVQFAEQIIATIGVLRANRRARQS